MAQARRSGQTEPSTKANGDRTKPMALVSSGTPMAMYMRASGKMTKPMGTVSMSMLMALSTKDTGKTISKMEPVLRVGQMVPNTRVATRKA